jgi:tetratricopeptide (TPR) repeat protein
MWEQIPTFIAVSAKNPLGIWALIIFALSMIGLVCFHNGERPIKIRIFILIFLGFGLSGCTTPTLEPATVDLLRNAEKYRVSGRNEQARAAYAKARAQFRQEQNRVGEANVLLALGDLERKLGRNEQAHATYTEARTLFRQVKDRLGEANVLTGLGHVERRLGRFAQARSAYSKARTLYERAENRLGKANVLLGLGYLENMLWRNEQAKENFYEAAYLYGAVGQDKWKERALRGARALDK